MKQRKLRWNVVPDEGGQALTEFVIVIPIVLIFFFAMLQYFAIVQASQLGNYAAFCAARVYAVSGAVDTNAPTEALTAASVALAPVARPVPGEIGGNTFVASDIGSIENGVDKLASEVPGGLDVVNYCEGYFMARYVRFNSSLLGGSVTCTNEGSPAQVDVSINYPQPIYVPGLAGLWNFVGHGNIYSSLAPLSKGLTGIPSKLMPLYADTSSLSSLATDLSKYDSSAASDLNSIISSLPDVMLPYVNIQSKCSMGYSAWSGIPRQPPGANATDPTPGNTNNPSGQLDQAKKARDDYDSAQQNAVNSCQSMCQAQTNLTNAQNKDDPIINNPKSSAIQVAAAKADLNNAQNALNQAQSNLNSAESNLNNAAQEMENLGQTMPPFNCSCG